jgi:hypothetical protein
MASPIPRVPLARALQEAETGATIADRDLERRALRTDIRAAPGSRRMRSGEQ